MCATRSRQHAHGSPAGTNPANQSKSTRQYIDCYIVVKLQKHPCRFSISKLFAGADDNLTLYASVLYFKGADRFVQQVLFCVLTCTVLLLAPHGCQLLENPSCCADSRILMPR